MLKNTFKILSKKTLFSSLVLSVMVSVTSATASEQPKGAAVDVATVKLQDVSPATWLSGDLISRADSRIATEVSGHLLNIAEVGQRVKKGEVLATLNDKLLLLRLRDNQTVVERLKTELNYLSRQISREKKLAEQESTSQSELDRLEMERDISRQELEAAKIQVERTRYLVEQSSIIAPFDGVVVERMANLGEYLSEGQLVLRFVNVDQQEITLYAPIHLYSNLSVGARVQLLSAQAQTMSLPKSGVVNRVIPVGNIRSRMLEIRVKPDSADWVIGEAVKVQLPSGVAEKRLTVPRDALVLRQNKIFVYTVDSQGKAHQVPVSLGASAGDYIAVDGNIREGDTVIVRGAERMRAGQHVRPLL
ncbi:efflux RND transporter periplasmic adaptor subunit [Pseudoalteromonas sp. JBTF-M23]|uniref:Efflux RND transporter periplasmic adaptor subunit n=1 Tax=Pseudoalteromonas caenipelagi TaxID=2726988 RepID=A0A849VD84_9GAMM|nr:efflux RND transporter periplasmic adaptor subunit [Pseudoalteromonas caenipelagi]NOU51266.1 efflux RND transporter periplasmic adaptor subunit [Pseudoalteromonas caenipelagi]